jgi:hypothetical protein
MPAEDQDLHQRSELDSDIEEIPADELKNELVVESGLQISPLGQTDTSSPNDGEHAASTRNTCCYALKPLKQMLPDWKRRLGRSASKAGASRLVARFVHLRYGGSSILSARSARGSLAYSKIVY